MVSLLEAPAPYVEGGDAYAVGFDLDGIVSDGTVLHDGDCDLAVVDSLSPIRGRSGIDNEFAPVLYLHGGPDPFPDAVRDGDILLVLELTADSLGNDGTASVRVSFATRPGPPCEGASLACPAGARCPAHADIDSPSACGPVLDETGSITPGQRFTIERELATVPAQLMGGMLSFELPALPLVLIGADGSLASLPLRNVHVTADTADSELTYGEIGGELDIAEWSAVSGASEELIRSTTTPDLHPGDDPSVCRALSAGLAFTAVEAELTD